MASFTVGKWYRAKKGFYDFMAPLDIACVKEETVFKVIERQQGSLPWYLSIVIEQDEGDTRTLTMDEKWEDFVLRECLEELT